MKMTRDTPENFIATARNDIEDHLEKHLAGYDETEVVALARYITLTGGHRWRPLVLLAAGGAVQKARGNLLPAACGIEIVHSATLLLDDLPSMDNAGLRRGKPCAHLVFPPWAVDMAAPFLVSMGYAMILENEQIDSSLRLQAALVMSSTAVDLCKGQVRDIMASSASKQTDDLFDRYFLKTGSLYSAAAGIGSILSGGSVEKTEALTRCAAKLGLAVQCFDDIADMVTAVEVSGKEPGNDSDKRTVISRYGLEGAVKLGRKLQKEALTELDSFSDRCQNLRYLVDVIPRAIVPHDIETYQG